MQCHGVVLTTFVVCLLCLDSYLCRSYDHLNSFTDSLLREVVSRMEDRNGMMNDFDLSSLDDYSMPDSSQMHKPSHRLEELVGKSELGNSRVAKEYERNIFIPGQDDILGHEPSLRDQEYLEHSSLFGHQYVQGGAGEGFQRLKPDGSMRNMQVVKSDGTLPAYCNPPNPCPLGYTAEDGCLENFVNSARFSSEYQAAQDCMCDTEHMFDCHGSNRESEIDALARSIQNEGLMDSTLNRIVENMQIDGQHKNLVAKKFFSHKPKNPFLQGDQLPVVAKKAPRK